MRISETASAKINLALHVTGQREDGYHLLDSLVAFTKFGDEISVEIADETSLEIDGPFSSYLGTGTDNIILKAAALFDVPLKMKLTKKLPVASGIGGGSADAAAVIRAACRLLKTNHPSADDILGLGADVPVCVKNRTCRMQGIGDVITPVSYMPNMSVVLINPRVGVSTPQIFKGLVNKNNSEMTAMPMTFDTPSQLVAWLSQQRNDLEETAISLEPKIADCLTILTKHNADFARMSGSGATCFGLFSDLETARRAAANITAEHPSYWCVATELG